MGSWSGRAAGPGRQAFCRHQQQADRLPTPAEFRATKYKKISPSFTQAGFTQAPCYGRRCCMQQTRSRVGLGKLPPLALIVGISRVRPASHPAPAHAWRPPGASLAPSPAPEAKAISSSLQGAGKDALEVVRAKSSRCESLRQSAATQAAGWFWQSSDKWRERRSSPATQAPSTSFSSVAFCGEVPPSIAVRPPSQK